MRPGFWRSGCPDIHDQQKHPRNSASADAYHRVGRLQSQHGHRFVFVHVAGKVEGAGAGVGRLVGQVAGPALPQGKVRMKFSASPMAALP